MKERTWSFDWASTGLGPSDQWPQSLRIALRIMLDSRYAMWLGWGPDFTFFYNDAYANMTLGPKHPWALGRSTREVWSEIWADVGPLAESVVNTGKATFDQGLLLFLNRQGFLEESYHTFSYSPIPDDAGRIGGMLCVVTEDTERIIGERRVRLLRELAARTMDEARSAEEACEMASRTLSADRRDLSFVLIYLLDGGRARLASAAGVPAASAVAPRSIDTSSDTAGGWPLHDVCATGKAKVVGDLHERFHETIGSAWPDPTTTAVVLPMTKPGVSTLAGFVIAGVSPRLALNDEYLGFLDLVAGQVANTVANARAYEEERRRAEALAELDRAKTAFFSNVSHEFRTPLTLMLGPVQDLLARSTQHLSPTDRAELEVVDRNGLRLLRLVNSLLDFSRIESGRIRAAYQPTDLARYTADLASVFRSACERAGLRLVVDCPPLGEDVYVDREMWEKVVLNLLSNAFKFTLEGEIAVSLRRVGDHAELRVRDTGTGIRPEEMPRLFERFHRIANAEGRTHEGTGIGLALVQELVQLQEGTVRAESAWQQGTTFIVQVPLGSAHVPEHHSITPSAGTRAVGAMAYVEEALRWLPDDGAGPADEGGEVASHAPADAPRVLVVDDNADMRQYIARLLAEHFHVDVAADGEAALGVIEERTPDLVLTDIMMPRLDGFGLLAAIRANPQRATLPVIMLSARAGEESRIEGVEAGADDYLVKPFSARELIARVTAHLQMSRVRRETTEALQRSHARFEAMFDAFPMGVCLVDSQMRVRQVNRAAQPVLEGVENLIGRDITDIIHVMWPSSAANEILEHWRHTLATGESYFVPEYVEERVDPPRTEYYEWELHRVALPEGTYGVVCYFSDISRHVLARQALVESERRLREAQSRLESTFEASEVGTWEFDIVRDTVRTDANMARMFGLSAAEAAEGKPLATFVNAVHEEDRPRVLATLERVLASEHKLSLEVRIVTAEGVRWTTARGRVERDESGRAVSLPGVMVNVTAQRNAEERARAVLAEAAQANAKFRAFFDQGAVFAGVMDIDGTLLDANRVSLEACGYTRAQVIGKPFWETAWWSPSAELVRHMRDISRRAALGETVREELSYFVADGSERNVDFTMIPIRDEGGRIVFLAPTGTDITDRKRAVEALGRKVEEMQTLLDTLPVGVFIAHDPEAKVITGNPAAHRLLRSRAPNLSKTADFDERPMHFRVCRNGVEIPANELPVQRAAAGELVQDVELDDIFDDGTILHTVMSAAPLYDEQGRVRGAVASVLDVTDRKRAEEALREADRRKDEFLATLSHELRNPLAPLLNGVHLMSMAGDDPATIEHARAMMERQLTQLVRLVDDLLDVSRISQGKLELRKARIDFASALEGAIETNRPLIEEMGHTLEVTLPDEPVHLDADLTRLTQVFMNLLSNAAKYSDPGSTIRIRATREGSDIVTSVRDDGIGIAADQLPQIFDVFAQVTASLERSRGGLGIGLSLVRQLLQMHGGTIEARSEGAGRGSEFIVRLPIDLEAPKPVAPAASAAPPSESFRVLIVDDNRDSADSLSMMIRIMGNETRTAYDGQEATEVAAEFRPHVILLDIGLPRLNGYEACRAIREQPGGRDIVIVAQTGWGQQEDRQRSREAGFDQHMVKPVDPAALVALLAKLAATRGKQPA